MEVNNEFETLFDQLTTLNPKQQLAIEALLDGKTHREAAEYAGCCRETVTEWANNHPAFRSVLHHARMAAFQESQERRSRIHAALEVRVLSEIESDTLSIEQLLAVAKALPKSDTPNVPEPVASAEGQVAVGVADLIRDRRDLLAFLLRRSLADDILGSASLDRDIDAEIVSMRLIGSDPHVHEGR